MAMAKQQRAIHLRQGFHLRQGYGERVGGLKATLKPLTKGDLRDLKRERNGGKK